MENYFNFECKYRESKEINTVTFESADSTQWTLTEEWITKTRDIRQRVIFTQENNFERRYLINMEVTCSNSRIIAGMFRITLLSKPYMTKITIPIKEFIVFRFLENSSPNIEAQNIELIDDVLEYDFRYKVTINRAYVPAQEHELPPRPTKLMMLSNQLLSLFETSNFSDAILTNGTSEIRVHRNILSARSNFFKCMFTQSMRENKDVIVYMPDIDFSILREMVRFMYCGVLRAIGIETAHDLFLAADKYEVNHLKKLCRDTMIRNIRSDNVHKIAILVRDHPDQDLKTKFVEHIIENFEYALDSGVLNVVKEVSQALYDEIMVIYETERDLTKNNIS